MVDKKRWRRESGPKSVDTKKIDRDNMFDVRRFCACVWASHTSPPRAVIRTAYYPPASLFFVDPCVKNLPQHHRKPSFLSTPYHVRFKCTCPHNCDWTLVCGLAGNKGGTQFHHLSPSDVLFTFFFMQHLFNPNWANQKALQSTPHTPSPNCSVKLCACAIQHRHPNIESR